MHGYIDRHSDNVAAVLLVRVRKTAWWEGNNAVYVYTIHFYVYIAAKSRTQPPNLVGYRRTSTGSETVQLPLITSFGRVQK